MGNTIYTKGLKELGIKLLDLKLNLQQRILNTATASAARVYRSKAASLAPRDSGRLSKAIYAKRIPEKSTDQRITYYVSVKQGKKAAKKGQDAYYWRWVEFGHMTSGSAKLMRSKDGVAYPIAPRPFLRPAADSESANAVTKFQNALQRGIEKYTK